MKKVLFPLSILFVCFFSCTPNRGNVITSKKVWVRIENSTINNFDSTTVWSVIYGSVVPTGITEYKLMPFPVYGGGCDFKINSQSVHVGDWICGSPPPPEFEAGYYTFKVIPAPTRSNYKIEVIKR
jgi:hypothetical protein